MTPMAILCVADIANPFLFFNHGLIINPRSGYPMLYFELP